MSTDGTEKSYSLEDKGELYLWVLVPESYRSREDLLVRVSPEDNRSDPDLYISKSNQKPNSYSTSDWGSSVTGEDVVSISSWNISVNSTFYIGIKCFKACNFKISALFSDELEVKTNVYHSISIHKGESKVLRYWVPDEKDIKSVEFIARMNSSDH